MKKTHPLLPKYAHVIEEISGYLLESMTNMWKAITSS